MIKKIGLSLAALLFVQQSYANTDMQIKTSFGTIEIELYDDKAPISVANFKNYAKNNFYNGTIFHRVIPGFMIQGGGMNEKMIEKSTEAAIKNESGNGLQNIRGTLAMARTNHPDSATSQFFINVANNNFLDKAVGNPGYAVFGKVTKGMEIVDKIVNVPTENYGMHQNVPKQPIKILNITYKATPNK